MVFAKCATCGNYHDSGECKTMGRYVEITLRFDKGHGLTHLSDTQEAVMKAIECSDAGEKGADLFKAATSALWEAIEKDKDFMLSVPGLSIVYEEDFDD